MKTKEEEIEAVKDDDFFVKTADEGKRKGIIIVFN